MPVFYGNVGGIIHREAQPEVEETQFCPKCGRRRPKVLFDSKSRWCSFCKEARADAAARRVLPVRCVETGEVYANAAAAARAIGMPDTARAAIRVAARAAGRTAGGYHWEDVL